MLGIIKNRMGQDGIYRLLQFDTRRVFIEFANENEQGEVQNRTQAPEPEMETIALFLDENNQNTG